MLIIQKLEYMDGLTENEKAVADYLVSHQNNIAHISITDIAKETYTSLSTTVRLAQKLDFSGWKEMKAAFIEETKYLTSGNTACDPNIPFHADTKDTQIAENIAALLMESIKDTHSLLSWKVLSDAADLCAMADVINIYGLVHIITPAYDFQMKMRSIGKTVNVLSNYEDFIYYLSSSTNRTISLLLSYSGETEAIIEAGNYLKNHHLHSIALTSIGGNTLSTICDYVLYLSTREKLSTKIGTYVSNESVHYLLDLLYSCCFARCWDASVSYKDSIRFKTEEGRSTNVSILKE